MTSQSKDTGAMLLPCPFCGCSLVHDRDNAWLHPPEGEGCLGEFIVLQDDDDIAAWNTRPTPTADEPVYQMDADEHKAMRAALMDSVKVVARLPRPTADEHDYAGLVERLVQMDGFVNPDGPEAAAAIKTLLDEKAEMLRAGNQLSLAAQTSGGTAGPDKLLVEKIGAWAALTKEKSRG